MSESNIPKFVRQIGVKNFRANYKRLVIGIITIYFVILAYLFLGWLTKYNVFIEQRDDLYTLIRDNAPANVIDNVKGTVAYLQGTATRSLHEIYEAAAWFTGSLIGLVALNKSVLPTLIDE